jgi:hypothetical protein
MRHCYMLESTAKGFISFVNNKPREEEINHFDGWSACAWGEFMKKDFTDEERAEKGYELELNNLAYKILPRNLYRTVCAYWRQIPTYGDLQDWIKENIDHE